MVHRLSLHNSKQPRATVFRLSDREIIPAWLAFFCFLYSLVLYVASLDCIQIRATSQPKNIITSSG